MLRADWIKSQSVSDVRGAASPDALQDRFKACDRSLQLAAAVAQRRQLDSHDLLQVHVVAGEQGAHLSQRQTDRFQDQDLLQPAQLRIGEIALAVAPAHGRQQALFLVVAQRPHRQAGAPCGLANGQKL